MDDNLIIQVTSMFNYNETSENVFQAGEPVHPHEWDTILSISEDRGRPFAVFDLRDERRATNTIRCPKDSMNIWVPIPDSRFPNQSDTFKAIGSLAAVLHEQGYIIWFHCSAGISRSTAANIAFRMISRKEPRDVAFQAILRARPYCGPNESFWSALLDLEAELFDEVRSGNTPAYKFKDRMKSNLEQ